MVGYIFEVLPDIIIHIFFFTFVVTVLFTKKRGRKKKEKKKEMRHGCCPKTISTQFIKIKIKIVKSINLQ